jgi:hypothetical protein
MTSTPLLDYLAQTPREKLNNATVAYLANLTETAKVAPALARSIVQELADQRSNLKLIASENYCSLATQLTMGNLLTDKYAEGYPHSRFYAGCDNIDQIEDYACEQARKLFGVEHAYVQPHSGADANMVAYWAILSARVTTPALTAIGESNPAKLSTEAWNKIRAQCGNQRLLGLDYYSGGHLTHGYRHNLSAQMFEAHSYEVSRETGLIDYDAIEKQALELKPLILLAGYSAYPRKIDFRKMREIADKAGSVLMVDMAHFAGLVAGGVFAGDYSPKDCRKFNDAGGCLYRRRNESTNGRNGQSSDSHRRDAVWSDWSTSGKRRTSLWNYAQPQFTSVRSERSVVHERVANRHSCNYDSRHGHGRNEENSGSVEIDSFEHQRRNRKSRRQGRRPEQGQVFNRPFRRSQRPEANSCVAFFLSGLSRTRSVIP